VNVFTPSELGTTKNCVSCGAPRAAHDYTTAECPELYRPAVLADAVRELTAARAAERPDRVFAARGEVQRLLGHRPGTCTPMCLGCVALLEPVAR
jgi:succinate dehydrogenase/fumarate reductase-like Fe-S protein